MTNNDSFTLLKSVLLDVEKLQLIYFEDWNQDISQIDLHLRAKMDNNGVLYDHFRSVIKKIPFGVIFTVHDLFLLNYTLIRGNSSRDFYVIGPYRSLIYDEKDFAVLSQKNHLTTAQTEELRLLLQDIPCTITNASAQLIAKNIISHFLGIEDPATQEINLEHTLAHTPSTASLQDLNQHARWIEEVYHHQHLLTLYISQGNFERAYAESRFFSTATLNRGTLDSRTSHRSYLYAANTSFRIVAQQVGVHPVYLDDISNLYVQKLANCISHNQLDKVYQEMIEAYCSLCREYPNRKYSQNIQTVINYILINLSDDLTPQSIAAAVNFSPAIFPINSKKKPV